MYTVCYTAFLCLIISKANNNQQVLCIQLNIYYNANVLLYQSVLAMSPDPSSTTTKTNEKCKILPWQFDAFIETCRFSVLC